MSLCIHGDVCREYLRQRRGIICQTCPRGCRFYEQEERTVVLTGAGLCPECRRLVGEGERYCAYCGARAVTDA